MLFDEKKLDKWFPVGAVVQTPMKRMAIVCEHVNRKEDFCCRVNLRYVDADKSEVCLQPELLKRMDCPM